MVSTPAACRVECSRRHEPLQMKIGRLFPDLLTPLGEATSIESGLERTVRRLVKLTGAYAGALEFRPPRKRPIIVTSGASRLSAPLTAWLQQSAGSAALGIRVRRV